MNKILPLLIILLSFGACTKQGIKTQNEDLGLVIAEGSNLGPVSDIKESEFESDCSKWGIAITVKTSTAEKGYKFDKEDKKCKKADVLFDGSQDIYSRAADPFVDITFNDSHGKLSQKNNIQKTANNSTILRDVQNDYSINKNLANTQYSEMGKLKEDYIDNPDTEIAQQDLIKQFESDLKQAIELNKEENMAYARALARHQTNTENTAILKKNQNLEYDKFLSREQATGALKKLTEKTADVIRLNNEMNNIKFAKEIEANNYKTKIAMLEKRVEDYAQLSLLLKQENQRLALTGKQANDFIAKDLNKAELNSDDARHARMMKLAKGIETDERLAAALFDAQKSTIQRKAQRLQTQADSLAYHARSDKVFNKQTDKIYQELRNGKQPAYEGKLARVVGVDINTEPALKDVQLLLNEKNRSIREILDEILLDIQPMLGTWKLDVKLATHNQKITKEEWNVSAETTLFEFFEYIKTRVKEIHGVDLSIRQYPETRKIVITDNF
ncbi:MAG: hypothetical protein GY793_08650 [Proteobacteria bacterium]|nr:hypothetical protein [Pseudomonadota bacterium]